MDLSILIPARREMFLDKTVENILENIEGKTEIIVVCDGNWPDPPVKDDPRVTMIYHSQSIGQRAATNEAAKLSRAKFIMKADAHCSFDKGFDAKLMADMQDDWTMIPLMKNLHVFDWVCKKCGDRRYQGPTPTSCPKCDNTTDFERDIVWISKNNPQSTSYCFDSQPHFQYFNDFKRRPEYKGDITETMSLQGSCFMTTRKKFFELELCDEKLESWGSQGIEVAAKTWLFGGRVVCNHKTWYGHLFRTQGGDFGFPWPCSGRQVARTRKQIREILFNNKWDKQIYPLSWLLDKFWPVPGWDDADRLKVTEAGIAFSNPRLSANNATSPIISSFERQQVPPIAVGFSGIDSGRTISTESILSLRNKSHMERIDAVPPITNDVVNNQMGFSSERERGNQPSIHNSMNKNDISVKVDDSISVLRKCSSPIPASSSMVNFDLGKDSIDVSSGKLGNGKIITISHDSSSNDELGLGVGRCDEHRPIPNILPQIKSFSKGIVYYTDNRLDERIFKIVQKQIENCSNGNEIISVSLKPIDFGKNVVLSLERSYLTMFSQILAGLEASTADIIFLVEHDVLYHPCHFEFIPPKKDVFYYNENRWFVDSETGRALFYNAKSTSGLCAHRELLVEHYRKRVERVEKEGFTRRLGFEPGNHPYPRGVDFYKSEAWFSEFPNIDIRHKQNLTSSRWRKDQFRNQRNLYAWKEADEIPFWGVTKGRFNEILDGIGRSN